MVVRTTRRYLWLNVPTTAPTATMAVQSMICRIENWLCFLVGGDSLSADVGDGQDASGASGMGFIVGSYWQGCKSFFSVRAPPLQAAGPHRRQLSQIHPPTGNIRRVALLGARCFQKPTRNSSTSFQAKIARLEGGLNPICLTRMGPTDRF